jgi:hypothetical protein
VFGPFGRPAHVAGSPAPAVGAAPHDKGLPIGGELCNIACVDDVLNNIVSKGQPMLHLVGNILEIYSSTYVFIGDSAATSRRYCTYRIQVPLGRCEMVAQNLLQA